MPWSSAERVARRGTKLAAAGLRSVQLWVPGTRAASFVEACRDQSARIAAQETAATRADDEAWEAASAEPVAHAAG